MGKMMDEHIKACSGKMMAIDLLIKLGAESTNDKPLCGLVQTEYKIVGNLLVAVFVYNKVFDTIPTLAVRKIISAQQD
jgi:hypothetical protein